MIRSFAMKPVYLSFTGCGWLKTTTLQEKLTMEKSCDCFVRALIDSEFDLIRIYYCGNCGS